jgi:glyceraldehyde-3-phosphate dehydrogenase (NADP+)
VVSEVATNTRLFREELFGPAVAVTPAADFADALRLANTTPFGLATAIFTRDVDRALDFARRAEAGIVHINWTPLWRVDPMPYGGLKLSGLGKEGPRYAIEEMTDSKTVIVHPLQPG